MEWLVDVGCSKVMHETASGRQPPLRTPRRWVRQVTASPPMTEKGIMNADPLAAFREAVGILEVAGRDADSCVAQPACSSKPWV